MNVGTDLDLACGFYACSFRGEFYVLIIDDINEDLKHGISNTIIILDEPVNKKFSTINLGEVQM